MASSIIDELLDRVVTHTSFLLNLEDLSFPSSGIHASLRVADHFHADPDLDSAFHFNSDYNPDPNPASLQSDVNMGTSCL